MTSNLVAGIDVASAAVRVAVCDETGTVISSAEEPLPPIQRPQPGWAEQDASAWWPASAAALRAATSGASGRGTVSAVCIAATSGTVVAVNLAGSPLGPALMYDDRRAAAQAAVAQEAGRDRWKRMGITITASFSLPRIGWLAAKHAGQPWRLAHVADYIGWRLAGHRVALDWSHALKSGYDVLHGEWAHEAFDALGVPPDVLPRVGRPTGETGKVWAGAAAETGLPRDCSIRLGMTDGCAGQLAAGAERPGQFATVLGTTLVIKGVTAGLVTDPLGSIYSHRHPAGTWLPGGASNTGGEALACWGKSRLDGLDHAAEARGPSTIVSWPLRRAGERFPIVRPDAEGFTVGSAADEADAYRADLEGVAYLERLAYDRLSELGARRTEPVITVGGGARSLAWSRIRASVLGDGVAIAAHASTSLGACLLAAAGPVYPDLSAAARAMLRPARIIEPEDSAREAMEESYAQWKHALRHRGWLA